MRLNAHAIEQVAEYARGLNDLEERVTSDYINGEQIKIASDVLLVDSDGDLYKLTDDGDGFALEVPESDG